jgi:hypothetical protein
MKTDNSPNASRLIEALRNTGYDNISSIADIVDNSIDAKANNINIDLIPTEKDIQIVITDDGIGMTEEILDEAMRLGSLTNRDIDSDLGKFGMGLVTASLSIGRRLTVVTKKDGVFITAIQDLDDIAQADKFEKELRKSDKAEIEKYNLYSKNIESAGGTMVVIEKNDLLHDRNVNNFAEKIYKNLGQIFRYFLKDKKIFIRGKNIDLVDPMMLDNKETKLYSDEIFNIKLDDEFEEKVRIRIVLLPDYDQGVARQKEVNIANQGFYLLRNNREIKHGETLGMFTRHNRFNRMRIEIFFSGKLDKLMGVTFTKRDIKPNRVILEKIESIVYPQIQTLDKKMKQENASSHKGEVDHDRAVQEIKSKAKLLIKPKFKIEKRIHSGLSKETEDGVAKDDTNRIRVPKTIREAMTDKYNCQFQLRSMGGASLFEVDQVGKNIIITYNIDHPFYQAYFVKNKDNQELINAMDYLFYSLSSAQLINARDENAILFENYINIFSSNLKTLIEN